MSPSYAYGQSIALEPVRLNICLNGNLCHLKRLHTSSIKAEEILPFGGNLCNMIEYNASREKE